MKNRLIFGLLLGAFLGVVCILGANLRMPGELSNTYLFAFWFNRLLMGMVIGLLTPPSTIQIGILRGLVFGALISFAFYSATEFRDLMGFFAGLVYGIIIEIVLFYALKEKTNNNR